MDLGVFYFQQRPQGMSQQRQELLPLPRRLVEQLPGLIFIEGTVTNHQHTRL